MRILVFATNNSHKLSEVRSILSQEENSLFGKVEVLSLAEIGCTEDIPETASTIEGNAIEKAQYVARHYSVDCFADDTGLEVEALDGAPGIYTARFGAMNGYGSDHDADANTACLLHKLEGEANRKAQFRTAIALVLDGKTYVFNGLIRGEITPEKRGEKGFGYDPVFLPEGYSETFAEMGADEKNKISHRRRAVEQLVAFLKEQNL